MGCHCCDGRGFVSDWSFEALKANALAAHQHLQSPPVQGTSAAQIAARDFAIKIDPKPLRFKPDAEAFIDDAVLPALRYKRPSCDIPQEHAIPESDAISDNEIHINVKKRTTLLFNFNN